MCREDPEPRSGQDGEGPTAPHQRWWCQPGAGTNATPKVRGQQQCSTPATVSPIHPQSCRRIRTLSRSLPLHLLTCPGKPMQVLGWHLCCAVPPRPAPPPGLPWAVTHTHAYTRPVLSPRPTPTPQAASLALTAALYHTTFPRNTQQQCPDTAARTCISSAIANASTLTRSSTDTGAHRMNAGCTSKATSVRCPAAAAPWASSPAGQGSPEADPRN